MATSIHHGSAKIYEFPVRGRLGLAACREQARPADEVTAPRVAKATFGSGWYHDAAIQEATRVVER